MQAHLARAVLADWRSGCEPAKGARRRRPLVLLAIMAVDMLSVKCGLRKAKSAHERTGFDVQETVTNDQRLRV